ncbi:MAG: hypothetical protein KAX20_03875 [Candidatus Omnitrophica bacterium]|nr:hypothetical protein [Candidatus Omnitrophota bacterium]
MVEMDIKQIEKAIEGISPQEQKRLERKLWALQMDNIVAKMRKAAKKNKITDKKIRKICEEVRQEMYERKPKSSN